MVRTQIRRLAAALLTAIGVLHLVLAPEYLEEKAYIGVLFILGGLTSLAVAARLWIRTTTAWAWVMGALLAAGMAVGFILSRSIDLPGFHESEWELSGVVSVLLEAGFVGALVWHAQTPNPEHLLEQGRTERTTRQIRGGARRARMPCGRRHSYVCTISAMGDEPV